MEEGIIVPQIDGNHGSLSNAPAAAVAALTGDTMTDLANIAREMNIPLDTAGNVAQQPKPVAQPQAAPTPVVPQAAPKPEAVEVPPKFQNPDGTANEEKIEKSTKSLEEKLAYYKSKEREFSQTQNKANNPAPIAPNVQQPQPNQGIQLTEFERQAAIDILNDARALGIQMSDQQAILQARADIRMAEAKYAAEKGVTDGIRRELDEQRMTAELRDLLEADDDLATPATADRVLQIKRDMGFKTYREAYVQHLGEEAIAKRTGQVKTPTPTGQTVKAPASPVGPVSRVQSTVNLDKPQSLSDADLEAAVRAAFPRYRGINK